MNRDALEELTSRLRETLDDAHVDAAIAALGKPPVAPDSPSFAQRVRQIEAGEADLHDWPDVKARLLSAAAEAHDHPEKP